MCHHGHGTVCISLRIFFQLINGPGSYGTGAAGAGPYGPGPAQDQLVLDHRSRPKSQKIILEHFNSHTSLGQNSDSVEDCLILRFYVI